MTVRVCNVQGCGNVLPELAPGAGGRPRKSCVTCSPVRIRPSKAAKPAKAPPVPAEPAPPVDETLSRAVLLELGECSGNVDGVLAMRIAKLIDRSEPTAAALAALAKQLRAHITAATAGRPAAPDGITAQQDEVARRRAGADRATA
jgi:hypothetical protein